jgi:hypothetical protein
MWIYSYILFIYGLLISIVVYGLEKYPNKPIDENAEMFLNL